MVGDSAAKTELVFAETANCWHDAAELSGFDRAVDRILAVGSWAPSQVILIIHVSPCKKCSVPSRGFCQQVCYLSVMRIMTHRPLRSSVTSKSSDFESTMR